MERAYCLTTSNLKLRFSVAFSMHYENLTPLSLDVSELKNLPPAYDTIIEAPLYQSTNLTNYLENAG